MLIKGMEELVELNNLTEVSKIMDSKPLNNNNMDNKQLNSSNMDNKLNNKVMHNRVMLSKDMDNKWETHINKQQVHTVVEQVRMELVVDMVNNSHTIHMETQVCNKQHSLARSKCHIMELPLNHNHMDQLDRKTQPMM